MAVMTLASTTSAKEKKWKVDDISFSGNTTFKKTVLYSIMELKKPFLLSSTIFTEYKLNSDLNQLTRFYRSQGFLNVKVHKNEVTRDTLRRKVDISIIINEGDRFLVRTVSIEDRNTSLDTSSVKSLNTKIDKPLIGASLESDISRIREIVLKKGHLKAEVTYSINIDSTNNKVDIKFYVNDGPRFYVDTIIVKGNDGLKKRVIERELEFKQGDLLSINKVRKTEQKLYRTNLLNYVQIEPIISDSVNLSTVSDTSVPTMITVDEVDFLRIEAGAGYGTAEGFRGSLITSYGNLFNYGHRLTLSGHLSQKVQDAELRYGVPWLMFIPLRVDGAGYIRNITDSVKTYSALKHGFEFTVGQQTDLHFAYQLRLKWEDNSNLSDTTESNNIQSIELDLAWDTRNDLINPVRGFYNQIQIQAAGLTGDRSEEFVKVTTDHRVYWKTRNLKWASALQLSWGIPYGKTNSLPLQARFWGGGSQSVRGFDEGALRRFEGENIGGNVSVIAHLVEAKLPLFWWIEGALFADAGYIWITDNEQPDPITFQAIIKDLRWTAGPGIRINTPIAVLRCDVGFKMDKRKNEYPVTFHFDIGNSF
jgi:outer membrane protein insertion porin family